MHFELNLSEQILHALEEINPELKIRPEEINITCSEDPSRGDFSTNCALKFSKLFSLPPMELGQKLIDIIQAKKPDFLDTTVLAPPGFINFFLSAGAFREKILEFLEKGEDYLRNNTGHGRKVLLEFLSANPTGPLTIAHGRHAACGDTLANILKANGYRVTREYYYNDGGRQMDILGRSLQVRYLQLLGERKRMFKEGYCGYYLQEIARKMIEKHRKSYAREKDASLFTQFAEKEILKGIKEDLSLFRVKFNSWVKESKFAKGREVKRILNYLKKKDDTYKNEGAVWFRATKYNDEKDRVMVRSTGEATYLVPDLAYHTFKYKRRYDKIITILGPDHHGYIGRLRAGIKAMDLDDKKLTIKILQLVSLYRGKKKMRMSTRAGEFVTLKQVIDEVGVDAARFFLCMRGMDAHLDFDLELAKKESAENPVYYIQYAHARICSIFKFARQKNIKLKKVRDIDPALLNHKEEVELIKKILLYPGVLRKGAELLEIQGLTGYLLEVASLFHQYYNKYRFIIDDEDITQARLLLAEAVRIILRHGLKLLGIISPKKM
jgi:arginyl-tRNA synthetase